MRRGLAGRVGRAGPSTVMANFAFCVVGPTDTRRPGTRRPPGTSAAGPQWAALGPRPGRERLEHCGQPRAATGIIFQLSSSPPAEYRRPDRHTLTRARALSSDRLGRISGLLLSRPWRQREGGIGPRENRAPPSGSAKVESRPAIQLRLRRQPPPSRAGRSDPTAGPGVACRGVTLLCLPGRCGDRFHRWNRGRGGGRRDLRPPPPVPPAAAGDDQKVLVDPGHLAPGQAGQEGGDGLAQLVW